MNKKGFTLIEIIAVIVILGVIMFIAVPSISRYVGGSRKDLYISDAKRFVDAAKEIISTKKIPINKTDITYYIPLSCLSVDKKDESPYGAWDEVYVVVTYDNTKYDYYFTAIDSEKMGVKLTYSEDLNTDRVENISGISTSISVGKDKNGVCTRDKIRVISDKCNIVDSEILNSISTCISDKQSYN